MCDLNFEADEIDNKFFEEDLTYQSNQPQLLRFEQTYKNDESCDQKHRLDINKSNEMRVSQNGELEKTNEPSKTVLFFQNRIHFL